MKNIHGDELGVVVFKRGGANLWNFIKKGGAAASSASSVKGSTGRQC